MTGAHRPDRDLRVLLVLDSLVPGGAETSTVRLLPHLIARGVEPVVAVLHDRAGLQAQVTDAGARLVSAAGPGGRPAWVRRLAALIDEIEPDLVHTSLYEADICGRMAAAWRRTPSVTTLPTELYGPAHLATPGLNRAKVRAAQAVDIATARLARRLHAVSHHVAATAAANLRYPAHRIDVIHRGRPDPGAHLRRAEIGAAVRAELVLGERPVVITVARQEEVKGLDRVLAALPVVLDRHPETVVVMAGREGGHTEQLSALIDQLAIRGAVRRLGHRDDVDRLLAAAQVFVLPSRREGLPGALLEAMAASTPAVVNDLPQITEVTGADLAQVVDAGDPRRLGDAVAAVLDDPDRSAAMAGVARRRFEERFTIDASADAMVRFYGRALGAGHEPAELP
jgi:glycosyltransferase involved in cell wall biosynthesis